MTLTHFLNDVNSTKETWNVVVRVLRLWCVQDFTKQKIPFSLEMGVRIHASVRRTLIYKFQNQICEDRVYSIQSFTVASNSGSYRTTKHEYKINFQYGTKVSLMANEVVPQSTPQYTPLSLIFAPGFDTDYLGDIIGVLTGVGTERELRKEGRTSKLNVISIDCDGFRIQCTLFGNYVDQLNAFLAAGEVENVVIAIQFAKVKLFRDNIYIQNCIDCTKVEYNVLTEEALPLKKRMLESMDSPSQGLSQLCESSKQTPEDEFLQTSTRTTIAGLKDCREVNTFIVLCTIKHVVDNDDWWYTACICNKAIYPDSKMFFCEKCNKHIMKVTFRYKVQLRVIDETDSTTFILFDREANSLLNKSCAEILETHDKNGNLPKEFADILEKKVLFKVDLKTDTGFRFEQTFRVKKICMDEDIIERFIRGNNSSLFFEKELYDQDGKKGKGKLALTDASCENITEDLLNKFGSECNECQSQTVDLSNDNATVTPLKRQSPTLIEVAEENLPLKTFKRNIKIEK
ncbi:replication protein A 70 kDa DNA-binding subunit B-like [Phaseolus vulgaris]|uniref:replication protein A 70 kDa DNA-binding subunit B-like n=1 Tax=Phaseolus vulgaris TaxID=3885 RepID=UPI0035CAFBAA